MLATNRRLCRELKAHLRAPGVAKQQTTIVLVQLHTPHPGWFPDRHAWNWAADGWRNTACATTYSAFHQAYLNSGVELMGKRCIVLDHRQHGLCVSRRQRKDDAVKAEINHALYTVRIRPHTEDVQARFAIPARF